MAYSVVSVTSERFPEFRQNLADYYLCSSEKAKMRCMLLDIHFPKSVVIASHLLSRSMDCFKKFFAIEDIDDMRNGLLLFRPLEYHFDHYNLSFVPYNDGTVRLKVFNKEILDRFLVDDLTVEQQATLFGGPLPKDWKNTSFPVYAPGSSFNILTKYGDLDGKELVFLNFERPFNRCLTFQAKLAKEQAIANGWIAEGDDEFEEVWSNEVPETIKHVRVDAFLKNRDWSFKK